MKYLDNNFTLLNAGEWHFLKTLIANGCSMEQWFRSFHPMPSETKAAIYLLVTRVGKSIQEIMNSNISYSACKEMLHQCEDITNAEETHIFDFAGATWTIYLSQK